MKKNFLKNLLKLKKLLRRNKMDKDLKKAIADQKLTDNDLKEFVKWKANQNESENQNDSNDEDSGDAEENLADDEEGSTGDQPKLTMKDLEKLIEKKINKLSQASKKKPTKPTKKKGITPMEGGIEFADFGLIPTLKKKT